MLNYLLAHPEFSFSAPDTADLCEAFDMALAELHAGEGTAVNREAQEVRAALAAEIVKARLRGVRDPRELRDHAISVAQTLATGGQGAISQNGERGPPR
jgi:hypothetical protein